MRSRILTIEIKHAICFCRHACRENRQAWIKPATSASYRNVPSILLHGAIASIHGHSAIEIGHRERACQRRGIHWIETNLTGRHPQGGGREQGKDQGGPG